MNNSNNIAHSVPAQTPRVAIHVTGLALSLAWLFLAGGCSPGPPHIIGLKPASPEPPSCAPGLCPLFSRSEPRAETLRPTFRWERFPRARDLEEISPHADERIASVSYELRLWKVGKGFSGKFESPGTSSGMKWIGEADDYKYSWGHECRDTDPGELAYSHRGIRDPEHTLETSLQPDSLYYWSIRAHFTLDGKRRATEWSELLPPEKFLTEIRNGPCSVLSTFHLIRTL